MPVHQTVMLAESMACLACQPGELALDCNLGAGGHTAALLDAVGPTGHVIALDLDESAIEHARERFRGRPITLIHDNFRRLREILDSLAIGEVDRVIFDPGPSLDQLLTPERGFSFDPERDGPLDMRYDRSNPMTAAEIVNRFSEDELIRILRDYGEEGRARRIARAIARARQSAPILSTRQLAQIVSAALPAASHSTRLHPASKCFLALRSFLNMETEALREGLTGAISRTRVHGRICALGYHSLEIGVQKEIFRQYAQACRCPPSSPRCHCEGRPLIKFISRKPVSPEEVRRNPRSRSAWLRCVERI